MKTKTILKCLALAGLLPLAMMAQTRTVIVDETFSDGSLVNEVYNSSSGQYSSLDWGARFPNDREIVGGKMVVHEDLHPTNDRQPTTIAQFKQQPASIANVNDYVSLSFDVSFTGTLGSHITGFQFGLFNSNGGVYNSTTNGGGTATDTGIYPSGYMMGVDLAAADGAREARALSHDNKSSALLNGGFAQVGSALNADGGSIFASGSEYKMVLTLMRLSLTEVQVDFDVYDSNGSTKLLSFSEIDAGTLADTNGIVTSFDTIGFWRGNSTLLTDLVIGNLQVAVGTAIPEPGTYAAILGAAMLAFMLIRRRRS